MHYERIPDGIRQNFVMKLKRKEVEVQNSWLGLTSDRKYSFLSIEYFQSYLTQIDFDSRTKF